MIKVVIIILTVILSACSSIKKIDSCAVPSLYYGEFCPRDTQCQLIALLRKEQVSIYYYGDHIYLLIPSVQLFKERQIILTQSGQDLLNKAAKFLACYQKIFVKVTGFSGVLPATQENIVFSKQRADAVSEYLWKRCIRTRVIYARGGLVNVQSPTISGQDHIMLETQRLP